MAAPPRTDPIEHQATRSWPTLSADGNVALRGVGSTELPEATTLALDRMYLLMEMAPQVLEHPGTRTKRSKLLIEFSVARSAQVESPELVECFRHEGENCTRCDGSGLRSRKRCARCGEAAGSVSEGTGYPLVKDRRTDGLLYHVRCLPGTRDLDAVWTGLEWMGG
jgi:hypothetical protein